MNLLTSRIYTPKTIHNGLMFCLFLAGISILSTSCKEGSTNKSDEVKKEIKTDAKIEEAEVSNKKVIMFYGNSLTAGYQLEESESFPSRIEDIIDSLKLNYTVVNAGLSGDTSYDGLKRLDWVLKTKVDVFVLELGANDMLRGLPLKNTRENLIGIIKKVKSKYPEAKLALCAMAGAPNMGADYVTEFEKIYKDLAKEEGLTYIPFFLRGVAGNPELLLQDGKHPNAKGQLIVATNIWTTLKTIL